MKIHVRLAAIAIVLSAACAALAMPARAAEYTLKWAVVTRGDMQEKFGHKLAEILPKATNGRVEVKVFPGGQLGSPAAMIEGLQLGTVEGYENPADFFVGVDPRFGATGLAERFARENQYPAFYFEKVGNSEIPLVLNAPGPHFRVEVTINPTFSPKELSPGESDNRQLGAKVSYVFLPPRKAAHK